MPLDEVEVKVNGKAKDSKNSKKAAKATEKEAEWETDGSEDEDDSEDDKPLGYVHPQAAIIAEQAALIRQRLEALGNA